MGYTAFFHYYFPNLNEKKHFLLFYPQTFQKCLHRIVGNEYLLESDYARDVIVCIPTADFA